MVHLALSLWASSCFFKLLPLLLTLSSCANVNLLERDCFISVATLSFGPFYCKFVLCPSNFGVHPFGAKSVPTMHWFLNSVDVVEMSSLFFNFYTKPYCIQIINGYCIRLFVNIYSYQ
ncbi:hypothetical protein IHE45_12G016600 [Dioscorea alata]|uniref:Uncharacterized protein n=1 Tax=Dioscorea alata TaxID=55571 RepID=A0ACB7V0K0_DIOAL|nr:hypothetical protein IHE45_12G016600 [Dioscorea alata]